MTTGQYRQATKTLEKVAVHRHMHDVYRDFLELFALSLRNVADLRGWQERENRYLEIVANYDREDLDRFAEVFAIVTGIMQADPQDVLGRLYMELEVSNDRLGQFFTPYDLARLVAAITAKDIVEDAPPIVRLHEPACGAGAFLVALTEQLRADGVEPQQRVHVDAEDVSVTAVHMTYIHLVLLNIPGRIAHRDSLTQETWDVWATPAHILGGWSIRLATADARDVLDVTAPPSGDLVQGAFDLEGISA